MEADGSRQLLLSALRAKKAASSILLMAYDLWTPRVFHRTVLWASLVVITLQPIRMPIGHPYCLGFGHIGAESVQVLALSSRLAPNRFRKEKIYRIWWKNLRCTAPAQAHFAHTNKVIKSFTNNKIQDQMQEGHEKCSQSNEVRLWTVCL